MAFTYDIGTDIGKVRIQLGDVDASAYIFEDNEIQYCLDKGKTIDGATIQGLMMLLGSKSHRVKRAAVHGLTMDDSAQIDAIKATIRAYGGGMPSLKSAMPALIPSDRGYTETT